MIAHLARGIAATDFGSVPGSPRYDLVRLGLYAGHHGVAGFAKSELAVDNESFLDGASTLVELG